MVNLEHVTVVEKMQLLLVHLIYNHKKLVVQQQTYLEYILELMELLQINIMS